MSPAEEFSTLAHELAHELLHRGNRRSATSRRIRETEAEATALVDWPGSKVIFPPLDMPRAGAISIE
jgi:hypothetical protein